LATCFNDFRNSLFKRTCSLSKKIATQKKKLTSSIFHTASKTLVEFLNFHIQVSVHTFIYFFFICTLEIMSTLTVPAVNTWNDRLKKITMGLASLTIPEVGSLVSGLIGVLWPDSITDIWKIVKDLIMNLVQKAIEERIIALETDRQKDSINGIRETLNRYLKAKNHEKGEIMSSLVAICDQRYEEFIINSEGKFLIYYSIIFAYLHLGILKERVISGKVSNQSSPYNLAYSTLLIKHLIFKI
jgi:hypothetical protein